MCTCRILSSDFEEEEDLDLSPIPILAITKNTIYLPSEFMELNWPMNMNYEMSLLPVKETNNALKLFPPKKQNED